MIPTKRNCLCDAHPPTHGVPWGQAAKQAGNRLETLWRALGGPELEREFRFHPTRRWRADLAHLPSRTLIEIEGGIYVNGRHNRGAGFAADLEKYLEAALAGWRVVRLGPNELTWWGG